MNILAVGAHPDDIEIFCGGTLAKYAAEGHKIFCCTATSGNIGSATLPKDEIAAIRKKEAAKAASLVGGEYICLDYDDELFYEDVNVRINFINMVRHCRPDVIFTHNPHDYNPDHELTSKIINDIEVMLPIAKIETEEPPFEKMPVIYYYETEKGLGFVPTDYVDITDHFETKKQMVLCHESQKQWMADNYAGFSADDTFIEDMVITAQYRGMQCGVKYAEAFIRCNDAYRMTPHRLLP